MTCSHASLNFTFEHFAFTDCNVHTVEMKATCDACGEAMRFLGAPVGSSLARPTAKLDCLTVALPMVAESEEPDTHLEAIVAIDDSGRAN